MILRILMGVNLLLVCPAGVLLGVMLSLSGGGMTPAFQTYGNRMMVASLATGIGCVLLAELFWRLRVKPVAYGLMVVPLTAIVVLSVLVEGETGFFSGG